MDETAIGRAGEFFCAHALELCGLRTIHVDLHHDDLWCAHPDGSLIRVQVKSRRSPTPSSRRCNRPRYTYNISSGKSYGGIFIFAALDIGIMLARTWDDVPPQTVRINPEEFTHEAQIESIKREFKL
jgi:hypothetical protein